MPAARAARGMDVAVKSMGGGDEASAGCPITTSSDGSAASATQSAPGGQVQGSPPWWLPPAGVGSGLWSAWLPDGVWLAAPGSTPP